MPDQTVTHFLLLRLYLMQTYSVNKNLKFILTSELCSTAKAHDLFRLKIRPALCRQSFRDTAFLRKVNAQRQEQNAEQDLYA